MTAAAPGWVVLLSHGSRDVRWHAPLARLQQAIAEATGWEVALAYLQLQPPSLEEVLRACRAAGGTEALVVPVFLSAGGHLLRDVPRTAAEAGSRTGVAVRCTEPLGEAPEVLEGMARAVARMLSAVGGGEDDGERRG